MGLHFIRYIYIIDLHLHNRFTFTLDTFTIDTFLNRSKLLSSSSFSQLCLQNLIFPLPSILSSLTDVALRSKGFCIQKTIRVFYLFNFHLHRGLSYNQTFLIFSPQTKFQFWLNSHHILRTLCSEI